MKFSTLLSVVAVVTPVAIASPAQAALTSFSGAIPAVEGVSPGFETLTNAVVGDATLTPPGTFDEEATLIGFNAGGTAQSFFSPLPLSGNPIESIILSFDFGGSLNVSLAGNNSGIFNVGNFSNQVAPVDDQTVDVLGAFDDAFNAGNTQVAFLFTENSGASGNQLAGLNDVNFTVNFEHEPVPEPFTILGTLTALGMGTFARRKYNK